ncbi:MAG: hypothetical protein GY867_01335 [bacterium]|nr:hypothetical protein [bacterium]
MWLVLALVSCLASAQTGATEVRGQFRYFFDNPAYIASADSVLRRTRTQLNGLLQDSLTGAVDIYLVESLERFDSLIGGSFPDWGAAAAIPGLNRIVLKSPDRFNVNKSLRELLAHEYAHLALAHRVGSGSPPRWLDEGVATMVSMEWHWSNNLTMGLASVMGHFVPLTDINNVNSFGTSKARLAYAESYLAVSYLHDEYGPDVLNLLLDSLAAGAEHDRALLAATGSDYANFEQEFRVYLQRRFNVISLVADTMYFWLALAIVVIIGAVVKMSRRKKYYDKWEREEELASTDFDYGDPDNPEQSDDDDESWRQ